MLPLFCGTAAAEEISRPQNELGTKSLPERISNKTAAKQPTAKELFGAVSLPAPLPSRAIGTYAKGCLAGGIALPINGPAWQVMRLSRNRNWGHPRLLI